MENWEKNERIDCKLIFSKYILLPKIYLCVPTQKWTLVDRALNQESKDLSCYFGYITSQLSNFRGNVLYPREGKIKIIRTLSHCWPSSSPHLLYDSRQVNQPACECQMKIETHILYEMFCKCPTEYTQQIFVPLSPNPTFLTLVMSLSVFL